MKIGAGVDKGFDRDDRGGEPAFHVAGAAAIDAAVPQFSAERIDRPAVAGLHDIDMGVEMHAGAGRSALTARHNVPTRIAVAVAGRAVGADHFNVEPPLLQPRRQIFADLQIGLAWRIERRDADQVLGQRDQLVASRFNQIKKGRRSRRRLAHALAPLRKTAKPR